MKKILMENARAGMQIGRNVLDNNGNLLLKRGAELNDFYLGRLQKIHVGSLYVETLPLYTPDKTAEEVVSPRTFAELAQRLKRIFEWRKSGTPLAGEVNAVAQKLVDSVFANKDTLVQEPADYLADDYMSTHAMQVSILALMLGIELGYNRMQLCELAVGTLLHDIGKMQLPPELRGQAGPPAGKDASILQQHPKLGLDMLREQADLPNAACDIVLQHHENLDGSGYPQHLKGSDICEYARIAAIADSFDALTAHRPHKTAHPFHEACALMLREIGRQYDAKLLKRFLRNVALYPMGTVLLMASGYFAVVMEVKRNFTNRPILRLIADRNKRRIHDTGRIDMRDDETQKIAHVLTEKEFLELWASAQKAHT